MYLKKPIAFAFAAAAPDGPAQAVAAVVPHNWQYGLPGAASPVMAQIADLHRLLLYVVAAAFVLLLGFLLWVMVRYHRRFHPVARKQEHNPLLQAAWVCIPIIVLVLIAIPSLRLLYFEATLPPADVTVDVVGRVGSWTYGYPKEGDFRFDSHPLDKKTAAQYAQPYLFAADSPLEVPANQTVEIRITSADVVHSWSVPALGVRIDAVPGRINRTWFKAAKPVIYYGMCSEMCGGRRDFMPVAVKVVSEAEYRGWLSWAYIKYAAAAADPAVTGTALTGREK